MKPRVIHGDNHLLVVAKPAGMPTMGNGETVHAWACDYVRRRYDKPGRVFLGVVHRLDAATTGVMVLARTSKAAGRLSPQFDRTAASRSKKTATVLPAQKRYLAIVDGILKRPQQWVDHLYKDDAAMRMRVDPAGRRGKLSQSWVWPLADDGRRTLIEVSLGTGRKHQIRVQAAERNLAVVGDPKYGRAGRDSRLMLHAWRLTLSHPIGAVRQRFEARLPSDFVDGMSPMTAKWRGSTENSVQSDPVDPEVDGSSALDPMFGGDAN